MEQAARLSWEAGDIERQFGVPAAKYTGANAAFALALGLLLGGAFYGALLPFRDSKVGQMFYERGAVPFAITGFAGWSLAILWIKWLKLRLQRRALDLRIVPAAGDFVLSPATVRDILNALYAAVDDPRHFLLLNRVARCLSSLKNMGRVSDVGDVLRSQAENDENYTDSTYALVQGFIWAIPVLGFIGTVLGLSDAVGGFGAVLAGGADADALKTGLRGVTAGLAVAFETTLVALVAALVIQLLMTMLRKREWEFLDACGDYCQTHIVNKVRIVPLDETVASEDAR